jgi:hypothetical protein
LNVYEIKQDFLVVSVFLGYNNISQKPNGSNTGAGINVASAIAAGNVFWVT